MTSDPVTRAGGLSATDITRGVLLGENGVEPVAPSERIKTLDILRGSALFGVLWANMNDWYGAPDPTTTLDQGLAWIHLWTVGSQCYTLLYFLFGIGFAIQLRRTESRGIDVRSVFYRRMLVLLGFGVVHGSLIWMGDILTLYAIVGFFLPLYRGLSTRRLFVATVATYFLLGYVLHLPSVRPAGTLSHATADFVYAHGTYGQIAAQRLQDYLWSCRRLTMDGSFECLALFLLGLFAQRADLAAKLSGDFRWLCRVLGIAIICAGAGLYVDFHFEQWWPSLKVQPTGWRAPHFWSPRFILASAGFKTYQLSTVAGYAAALALLVRTRWGSTLEPLATVGRMTLTTYLVQSIVCTTLFYGYGFGWYGRVHHTGMLAIALTLFALQMAVSVWWLRRFRFGPAEWLWRSLTYGRRQPMKMVASVAP